MDQTVILIFILVILAAMNIQSAPVIFGVAAATAIAAFFASNCSKYDCSEGFAAVGDFENEEGETIATRGSAVTLTEFNMDDSAVIDPKWDNTEMITRSMQTQIRDKRDDSSPDGDEQLMIRSQGMAKQTEDAIINRTRFTSDNFRPIFQEELDEEENEREWWNSDHLESQMVKDEVEYS